MENKFKNEMNIKLGGEEILLRPTFENVASMEAKLGGIAYLAWKLSRSATNPSVLPSLTDLAQIIYFNQAATKADDQTKKKHSLDEVWALVQEEGLGVVKPVTEFLARIAAGNKMQSELTENQKKN